MNAARKLLLLVLVVVFMVQGCAGTLRCLDRPGGETYAAVGPTGDDEGGLVQTRGRDVRAAIWLAAGIVIIGAFIVDLFILPYSCYSHRHYFPCCTEVIRWCH
jgi:hypothetical protein